jgi:type I restriction-modification system DNA methylase subunit/predicted DNA-binding transcriptional regulator AlpA
MAEAALDMITMADIARLAGQSRSTVGNWKSRNPEDFPPERGRGPRGPLYDRAEVTEWLETTNRLDKRPPDVAAVWRLADKLRDDMPIEEGMSLILVLLAVMSSSSRSDWQRLQQAPPAELDEVLRATVQSHFLFASEVMPHSRLGESVAQAVAELSRLDSPQLALMADALLEQAAEWMGGRGGEYLSPRSVRKLVVAIAEPVGSVYNPASGIGQLMIDAAREGNSGITGLVGQEINSRVWALAQLNLVVHRVDGEIALGDVFGDDHYPELRADRVVCVPPWNQKAPVLEKLMGDRRWLWGEPASNDGNAAWIQHCLYHLADRGRAVIVMPSAALFESGRAGRIRQRIIKAGLLDAVIALPPGLFAWTSLPCSVLVFAKGRRNGAGKPAPTLMIDLSDASEGQGFRYATLEDDLINDVASLYRSWVAGAEPASENAAVAQFDDLAANDFVIDPRRYLAVPHLQLDHERASRKRSDLLQQLERLTSASRAADAQLREILEARHR